MFAAIITIILAEFLLSLLFPAFSISINGNEIAMGAMFALFLAGYAGGLQFSRRMMRRMRFSEHIICTALSYLLVTLIPLLLLSCLVFAMRDQPEISDVLSSLQAPFNFASFAVAYVMIDLLILWPTLFVAIGLGQRDARKA